MLSSKPTIGFIPTKSFTKAEAFYAGKLGLRLVARDDFALVYKCGDTMIRVVRIGDFSPARYTIFGWRVTRIRQTVAALKQRGVAFVRYPGMMQDDLGIWSAPGGAKVAWFKDPDGNVLSLSYHPKKRN